MQNKTKYKLTEKENKYCQKKMKNIKTKTISKYLLKLMQTTNKNNQKNL